MPQSRNLLAYADLIEGVLEPASLSEKGLSIECLTTAAAFSLSKRLQSAIRNLRRQSVSIYPEDHSRHGKTDYDTLVIQQSANVVYVRKADGSNMAEKLQATIKEIL